MDLSADGVETRALRRMAARPAPSSAARQTPFIATLVGGRRSCVRQHDRARASGRQHSPRRIPAMRARRPPADAVTIVGQPRIAVDLYVTMQNFVAYVWEQGDRHASHSGP